MLEGQKNCFHCDVFRHTTTQWHWSCLPYTLSQEPEDITAELIVHNPVNKCYWCNSWPMPLHCVFLRTLQAISMKTEAAAPAHVTSLKYLEAVKMEELLLFLKLSVSKRQGDISPGSPIITFQMFHKSFFFFWCVCVSLFLFKNHTVCPLVFFTFRQKFLSNAWQANLRWLFKTDIYQFKHLICTLYTAIINHLRDHCILFLLTI